MSVARSALVVARIVEVGEKPHVTRRATATGTLKLQPATLEAIQKSKVPKGDVLTIAQVAGLQAIKRTPEWLPLCHPIPLTGAAVTLDVESTCVRATATVHATYQTGVEMEALTGVSAALLCVWDMVKALEKDANGQYPSTEIENLRVTEKHKGTPDS